VITLLILNVHLDRDQELTLQTLVSLGPEMLAFALTFVIVGVYWVSHHSMMHMINAVDRRLLWLNLLLLLAVVFVLPHICLVVIWASLCVVLNPAQRAIREPDNARWATRCELARPGLGDAIASSAD
jgi:uncharacterized membrane protein